MSEYSYKVSPDFDPTVTPEGYIWDETAFKELVKATDKAHADETIYAYGGAQGDKDIVYENAADLTLSNKKYNDDEQVVDTTITANTFNNTNMVTTDGAIAFSLLSFINSSVEDFHLCIFAVLKSSFMQLVEDAVDVNVYLLSCHCFVFF